ncbi:tail fiber protein [Paenibacillus solani]|uniref:Right handed beta helix domain-containing protein n=1 Tax=Paenibacillus solani TaxID=1705565 RepID=A0A0M1NKH1_9BACL|nr:tail fiber protein [Paenibacillus solani]KOR82530.1 hypothetical protein AM231_19675 [Paenibacillus solani]
MSSNTPNLGLLKKDPMVDGNETFNIETMLNENWDKVDEAVGKVREDLKNIDVDIPAASLTQKGIVQLSNALNSNSVTEAATPKSVNDATKYTDTKIASTRSEIETTRSEIASTRSELASTRSEIQQELSNLKINKANLNSPVFSGTPKVGSANIVTSSNIGSYVKPPDNFDGTSGERTLTVGPGKMFPTIQAAIDSLPAFRAYDVTIKPDSGTYPGFKIVNKHGGSIYIYGYETNVSISSTINISSCTSNVGINKVSISSNAIYGIEIQNCFNIGISYVTRIGGSYGIMMDNTPIVILSSCNFSNISNYAIWLRGGGTLRADSCTGSGNYAVYSVSSAILFDSSPNLTGTNRIFRSSGGQVYS